MDRRLELALAPVGLSLQKFNVLMELAASSEGRLSLTEVGRRLIRSAANLTTLIDRVEGDGYVRRVADPDDGRVTLAELTEAGWRILRRATRAVFDAERQVLRVLPRRERMALTELLQRVEPQAEDSAGPGRRLASGDGRTPRR